MITEETKREAEEKVDKTKRYAQILGILKSFPIGLTAKEMAVEMRRFGFTPTDERNFAAPRLTELAEAGRVVVVGKRLCRWTGRKVAVYTVAEQ